MKRIALNRLFEGTELFSVKERKNENFTFEGGNKSRLLIICNTRNGCITPDEKKFLGKILSSVKVDLNDAALMNYDNSQSFHELKSKLLFSKLILFGLAPSEIGLNISCVDYFPVNFQGTEILVCESLVQLSGSESSKTLLWSALKKMFVGDV